MNKTILIVTLIYAICFLTSLPFLYLLTRKHYPDFSLGQFIKKKLIRFFFVFIGYVAGEILMLGDNIKKLCQRKEII